MKEEFNQSSGRWARAVTAFRQKLIAATIKTPKKVLTGIALMVASVLVAGAGYFRAQAMSGDFQPIALVFVSLGCGVLLSVTGIVCVIVGAEPKPRSLTTKVASAMAGLFLIVTVFAAIALVRVFAT